MLIVGLGGLVSSWLISEHIEFFTRGFRMQWVKEGHWLYEERAPTGEARLLPCERVTTGDGGQRIPVPFSPQYPPELLARLPARHPLL
jgi:hypothetical protein